MSPRTKFILRVARDLRATWIELVKEREILGEIPTIRECVYSAEDAVNEYLQGS